MSQSVTERYDERIAAKLSCYDRQVITGTLPVVCYAAGLTGYLNAKGIRIFDYPEFARQLRELVCECAAALAAEVGVTTEHIGKPHIRKEDVVARVLDQRTPQDAGSYRLCRPLGIMRICGVVVTQRAARGRHRCRWRGWDTIARRETEACHRGRAFSSGTTDVRPAVSIAYSDVWQIDETGKRLRNLEGVPAGGVRLGEPMEDLES